MPPRQPQNAALRQKRIEDHAKVLRYRIDKEVAHPLGLQTSTLFRVSKFKYWGRKFIAACTR